MTETNIKLPQDQQAIRDKCFHPSGTFVEFPIEDVETSIPARFEKVVRLYPNNLAIKMGDQSFTYDALNRYANRIARAIIAERGLAKEPIALLFENGIDLVAAIFGVLKAGKFYVVQDPSLPSERLRLLLKDSGAKLLITNQCHQEVALKVLRSEQKLLSIEIMTKAQASDNVDINVQPHDLNCIQYTSGSTGTPKGVVELHRNVLLSVGWMTKEMEVQKADRFSLLHSLSFASAYVHLRLALLNGAALLGVDATKVNIYDLGRWISDEQITILHSPPALFRQLAESLPEGKALPNLRLIRLSGAPITRRDFDLYKTRFPPHTHLRIGMGSTEARGICAVIVDHNFSFPEDGSPVGYPPPGKKIFILDEANKELAPGQVGEIAVEGRNLNPHYWGDLAQQKGKFLLNPKGEEEKIYLTGDLGRMLPDGFVIHLGRKDLMVKIRGYRVDFSEIERALLEHPSIQDAGVRAWDREDGEKYLAAYIVLWLASQPNVSEIRRFLTSKLPDYMVPSVFKFMKALPLTNGKLDRQALPQPDPLRPALKEAYVAPRNETEKKLAAIWSEVFQIEDIGIHDNFFDLGGYSLAMTKLISRLMQTFRVELPIKALFEVPTIAKMAIVVTEQQGRQLRGDGIDTMRATAIPRRLSQVLAPLSFAQERLWFFNQLEPGSAAYNEPSAIRLTGDLDFKALERALNSIIARHEVLRTSIILADETPMQRIAEARTVDLPMIDLRSHRAEERDTEARRIIDETIRRPFNLTTDLMLRVLLVRTSDWEHLFVTVKHHIATDGWSAGIFWQEFAELYKFYSSGGSANLPELPLQYADYALWQREWLKGEELGRQLSYWKKQLDGAPEVLHLAPDRDRLSLPSNRGASQTLTLSKELSQKLKALSRNTEVTLYMSLLAAFQTLLYRYTGQEDIVVGSPIANRTRNEIEGLIGFFVNTLVLRTKFSDNPSFRELLHQVRTTALEAYEHQHLPFEKLVEELRPERSLNHSPLCQVMFNMNETGDFKLNLPGLTSEPLSISGDESKFDLTLYSRDQGDAVRFNLVYRIDLFSESWAKCFLDQYSCLLAQIADAPEQRVGSYALVTAEARKLLPDPTAVIDDHPQELTAETFLSWAEQNPAQIAIIQGQHTWTYGQLAEHASMIGRGLKAAGLKAGDVIAVHGCRSPGLIASILGTFMSGGVLLLIDPQLPDQRKQLMLKEGRGRKILFVGDGGKDWIKAEQQIDSLSIESATGAIVDLDRGEDLQAVSLPKLSGNDPAYIFFTSGSTGIPKAVLGCHKGLSHFLDWQRQTFVITPSDRVAQLTNLSFDPVLRDIFLPLTSGAALCLPEITADAVSHDTTNWLQRERISVLHTVPSLAETWLTSSVQSTSLPSLRWVFFAGEPLTDSLVSEWRSRLESKAEIVNLYGPTETTLAKCFYRVPANPCSGVQPVGSPIMGAQALVLSHDGQLCGINEPGEIALRTPFRCLGYLNAPEETQKRLAKNPFREDPDDVVYFTGDRGRYRPDGSLEILGRIDDQVKVRGVRVEPAEIAAILSQHSLVDSCFVVGRKDEREEMCLVAYVIASTHDLPTSAQLRSYLLDRLPIPMVPSIFVFVEALPLTPNGKVDRNALPQPDYQRHGAEDGFLAPRNPIEQVISEIWAEVLKIERIGIHDNFFDAGGHSLLAVRVLSRITQAFQSTVSLKDFFESPTVAQMANVIEEQKQTQTAMPKDLERFVTDLENISEDDAQRLLTQQSQRG